MATKSNNTSSTAKANTTNRTRKQPQDHKPKQPTKEANMNKTTIPQTDPTVYWNNNNHPYSSRWTSGDVIFYKLKDTTTLSATLATSKGKPIYLTAGDNTPLLQTDGHTVTIKANYFGEAYTTPTHDQLVMKDSNGKYFIFKINAKIRTSQYGNTYTHTEIHINNMCKQLHIDYRNTTIPERLMKLLNKPINMTATTVVVVSPNPNHIQGKTDSEIVNTYTAYEVCSPAPIPAPFTLD